MYVVFLTLKALPSIHLIYSHSSIDYLFNESKEANDADGTRKYDQILSDLKSLLAKNNGYKVYVTGHSLGAAVSSIAALHFACDPTLPKPIRCINFASPRMGGEEVFDATMILEKTNQLRMVRSVNENDLVTTVPSIGYEHVGIQVTTYYDGWFSKAGPPDIAYRNANDGWYTRFGKAYSNSVFSNFNLGYDHHGYIERIVSAKEHLEKKTVDELYKDEDFVGYDLLMNRKRNTVTEEAEDDEQGVTKKALDFLGCDHKAEFCK